MTDKRSLITNLFCKLTFGVRSQSKSNSACCRDMTGLSNQALFFSPTKPLVGTLDARPIRIDGF